MVKEMMVLEHNDIWNFILSFSQSYSAFVSSIDYHLLKSPCQKHYLIRIGGQLWKKK